MPICLQVADNSVNGISFKRKLGEETTLGVWLSRRGMGHLSKTTEKWALQGLFDLLLGFWGLFLLWVCCFLF